MVDVNQDNRYSTLQALASLKEIYYKLHPELTPEQSLPSFKMKPSYDLGSQTLDEKKVLRSGDIQR